MHQSFLSTELKNTAQKLISAMEWDGNDVLDDEDVERTGRRRKSLVLSSPYPARRLSILSTTDCPMTVSEKWAVLRRPSTVSLVKAAPKLNDDQRHSSISSIITTIRSGFIFVRTVFDQKGKCSPFLKLTPTPRQMPRDVTNISED